MAEPVPVRVRPIPAAATHPIRMEILRPGQPPESVVYPGDDDPDTVHFGAISKGDDLVGIASLYAEPRADGGPSPGWRLRGMATAAGVRGRGVGRALVDACVAHVAANGGGELWCNARVPALGFYAGAGFEVVSDEFEIEGIGAHVVMRTFVPADSVTGDRR
jgi:predicted GNAT family N-acyltransferase